MSQYKSLFEIAANDAKCTFPFEVIHCLDKYIVLSYLPEQQGFEAYNLSRRARVILHPDASIAVGSLYTKDVVLEKLYQDSKVKRFETALSENKGVSMRIEGGKIKQNADGTFSITSGTIVMMENEK